MIRHQRILTAVGFGLLAGLGLSTVMATSEPKTRVLAAIVNKTIEPTEYASPDAVRSTAGEAARQAAFRTHLRELWPDARTFGISQAVFDGAIADLTHDGSIVELADNQPEHTWAPWDYLDRLVSERRIVDGGRQLTALAELLAHIEQRYGVSKHVVVAIWGIESNYGTSPGSHHVLRALATLSHSGSRRAGFGREQFLQALKILQNGDVSAERMTGSWAGAMGHTQFIPSTYNAHAVDFDGDGRRDIWGSVADALASTANYLKVSGWQPGVSWGFEVRLSKGFVFAANAAGPDKDASAWSDAGLTMADGSAIPPAHAQMRLELPAGVRGPAFLVTPNFKAILRYNHSLLYALAVGQLSDQFQGRPGLQGSWPRDDKPLAAKERVELQELLVGHGFSTGGVDGIVGRETRAAVRAYQRRRGLAPDGYPGAKLLGSLRAEVRR